MLDSQNNSRKKRFITAFLTFLFTCAMVCIVPAKAFAETSPLSAAGVFRVKSGEDSQNIFPAVVFSLEDEIYCLTVPLSQSDLGDTDTTSASMTAWEKWHTVNYYGSSDYLSMWTIASMGSETETPLPLSKVSKDEVCTLVYATSIVDADSIEGIRITSIVDLEDNLVAFTGMEGKDANYPAALVNSQNRIVAIAINSSTAYGVINEDSFAEASGGSSSGDSSSAPSGSTGTDASSPASSDSTGSEGSSSSKSSSDGSSSSTPVGVAVLIVLILAAVIGFKVVSSKKKKVDESNGLSPVADSSSVPVYLDETADSVTAPLPPTYPTEVPRLWLVSTGGYMMGRIYPMDGEEITIGRSPSAAVPYQDESVSKLHCKLYKNDSGAWMLMDCNSRNGTYLQRLGKLSPMLPVEVHEGDIFFLSNPKNSFEIKR